MKNSSIKNTVKGLIILISALGIALVLSVTASIAAYTNSRHAQRTVATYEMFTIGEKFSSNTLAAVMQAKDNVKYFYTASEEEPASGTVTVCNYPRGKQTKPNEEDVTYSVSVRLVRYDASSEDKYLPTDAAYITENSLSGHTVTVSMGGTSVTLGGAGASPLLSYSAFGGTLLGGEARSHSFTVSFSTSFITERKNLYLEMTAVPSNENLHALKGIIKPEYRLGGAANAWVGAFEDDTSYAVSSYDGFNYVVSGTGSGTCTLRWDPSAVELDYLSLSDLTAIPGATSASGSVTFRVDSDYADRYELRFYIVDISGVSGWTGTSGDNNDMDEIVTLSFTAGA